MRPQLFDESLSRRFPSLCECSARFTRNRRSYSRRLAVRIFSKTTDLSAPSPAKAFVFIDDHPDFINWGNFFTDMSGYRTNAAEYEFHQDVPAVFHNFGTSVSFADGRGEIHRWLDLRTAPSIGSIYNHLPAIASPRNPDIAWLQDHATRPK